MSLTSHNPTSSPSNLLDHHDSQGAGPENYGATTSPTFTVASGTTEQRTQKAREYLATPLALMSSAAQTGLGSGSNAAESVKRATVTNLIAYFGLDPASAYDLLWEYPNPAPEVMDQCWMDRLESRFGENTFLTDEEFDAMAQEAVESVPSLGLPIHKEAVVRVRMGILKEILRLTGPAPSDSTMTLAEFQSLSANILGCDPAELPLDELQTLLHSAALNHRNGVVAQQNPGDGQPCYEGICAETIQEAKNYLEYLPFGGSRWRLRNQKSDN